MRLLFLDSFDGECSLGAQCCAMHCRVAFPKEEIRTAALIGEAGEAREGPTVFSAY